jgi:TatD DNase family protein
MIDPNYFDTHSHIHFPQFDEDRHEVIARMEKAGIWSILVATNDATSRSAIALADKHSFLFATVGVHPTEFEHFTKTHYETLANRSKVVAIGECGLDYYRRESDDGEMKTRQAKLFEDQIRFAIDCDKPLMLHVRPSSGSTDAHDDAIAILARYKGEFGEKLRGTAHFFTSTLPVAKQYIDLGFHISIPGVITFAKELEEVVAGIPLDRLLSETDSPYAAPIPHRGGRNEPLFVSQVVHAISHIKKVPESKVRAQLFINAARLFGISLQ